jgi:hypothetical protein
MHIDGSWVDGSSLGVAILSGASKPFRHWLNSTTRDTETRKVIIDVLSGASLVPFLLMIGAVVSSDILTVALETNKLFMALGGIAGLLLTIAEIGKFP